jgi:ATP-binding cassette subfamily C (CFTR/MRP) protein 1
MSSAVCSPTADSAFGPAVEGCRQGFDFTLAFESYFFSIVPSVLLLCFAPLRFKTLSRVRPKIKGAAFKYVKLVSWQESSHKQAAAHKSLLPRWSLQYSPSFN